MWPKVLKSKIVGLLNTGALAQQYLMSLTTEIPDYPTANSAQLKRVLVLLIKLYL